MPNISDYCASVFIFPLISNPSFDKCKIFLKIPTRSIPPLKNFMY